MLGEVDRGFIHMMERLAQERIGAAVCNIAQAAQILDETIEYVKQRKAFGQAVGSFQHNKFLVAELVTKVEVAQAFVDTCVVAHGEDELTAVDAAKAKWWSAQVQNDVLDACVQLYGGYGYMNEYRVARAWRDARVTKIWAGTNEIMKELIGRDLGPVIAPEIGSTGGPAMPEAVIVSAARSPIGRAFKGSLRTCGRTTWPPDGRGGAGQGARGSTPTTIDD